MAGNPQASTDAMETPVITLLIAIYLGGWMLVTTAALTAEPTLGHDRNALPTPRTFAVTSLAAGATWPLLLIGVVQFGSVLIYSKLHRA
ncbi:MAG TPA: hypothetical protein VH496_16810 [Mycobacterium sp.]